MKFKQTFSKGEKDLGHKHLATHRIDTGDSRPARQQLRRHPPLHEKAIQKEVGLMLEHGVIEPAQSPWAANLVMVERADKSFRPCIDYRPLNHVTKRDPLPRIDQCLDSMNGSMW